MKSIIHLGPLLLMASSLIACQGQSQNQPSVPSESAGYTSIETVLRQKTGKTTTDTTERREGHIKDENSDNRIELSEGTWLCQAGDLPVLTLALTKTRQVSATANCNRFFAQFSEQPDTLFSPFASTRKACSTDRLQTDQDWLRLLKNSVSFQQQDVTRLVFLDTEGKSQFSCAVTKNVSD